MRGLRALLLALLVVAVAIVAIDAGADRWTGVRAGSVEIPPRDEMLEALPDDPECTPRLESDDEPCARRYAFRPDATLTAWVSVRNDGPVPLTLLGISGDWLDRYDDVVVLVKPVAVVDGGDPHATGGMARIDARPFEPITLAPRNERLIGIELTTSGDVAHACADWMDGSAVQWASVPLSWRWLAIEHAAELDFDRPVEVLAPTGDDCA